MQQILEAIYENGAFRPLQPPQLVEGQIVQLVVNSQPRIAPDEILAIAASVYQGLSENEVSEIEQIACDRANFMGLDVEP